MKLKLYPLQSGLPVCSLPTLPREGGEAAGEGRLQGGGCITDSCAIPPLSNILSCSLRNISQSYALSLSLPPPLSFSLSAPPLSHTPKTLTCSLSHRYQTPVPFCLKPVLPDLLYSRKNISQTGTQFVPKLFASSF